MRKAIRLLLKTLLVVFLLLNVVIAMHAYKFTHFYDRGDPSVKNTRDKTSWDVVKDMLTGINAAKQENLPPGPGFETVWLTTKDNIRLEGWFVPVTAARGTVILFHGHGSKKSAVLDESAVFRKLGYNTFLLDFRAHGNSGGNTCTIGYRETEDVKLAYDYVSKRTASSPIVLYGISMGASTIIKAIKDYELQPARIILDMPFGSLPAAVKGRIKLFHLPEEPFSTLLTFWGGIEHGFWAYNFKPYEYAQSIKCPVLLQRGLKDPRVSAEETQLIYENISAPKKLVLYPNSGHESLCDKEPATWTAEVTAFLQ